eukprot:TRINITY_DN3424_c0_g3_i1.p1 TRINITY_DN3424_c0_g3~~TRINITY_DN3424_c0_g3_i1.p1  ORF type:complete len:985 (+),score=166.40 TRINITY_DN3424_c0_g3_i1:88-2955(+)
MTLSGLQFRCAVITIAVWEAVSLESSSMEKCGCVKPSANPNFVQGGTLNPTTIPKFVAPLIIVPVMQDTGIKNAYQIAMRQFKQQILPGGIWNNPLWNKRGCKYDFPATDVWGYGPAGSAGSQLPDSKSLGGDLGVAPAPNSQFNYPACTVENTEGTATHIDWINDLVEDPWTRNHTWARKRKTASPFTSTTTSTTESVVNPQDNSKDGEEEFEDGEEEFEDGEEEFEHDFGDDWLDNWWDSFRHGKFSLAQEGVRGLKKESYRKLKSGRSGCEYLPHLFAVDRSLHWANPEKLPCMFNKGKRTDCMPDQALNGKLLQAPYRGPVPIVTHVHGVDEHPESDGFPEAWYLPDACNIPEGFARHGSMVNQFGNGRETNHKLGVASFSYTNKQPSTTLWYHDHALGITRTTVYAGPVGFYLIRAADGKETGLTPETVLPGPAPQKGQTLAELNFPELDGKSNDIHLKIREMVLAIQDRSFNVDGSLYYPSERLQFEEEEQIGLDVPVSGHLDAEGKPLSDIHPIWNPDFFGNVMVVNGVAWPVFSVAPERYRFRVLNGCNSRFLNLYLIANFPDGTQKELPFYQIGNDQGILPAVVEIKRGLQRQIRSPTKCAGLRGSSNVPKQQALLMGPAERVDLIVDFTGLPRDTIVSMKNSASDTPFHGDWESMKPADPETTGQVMQFHVVHSTPSDIKSTPVEEIVLPHLHECFESTNVVRDVILYEAHSAKVCVDGVSTDQPCESSFNNTEEVCKDNFHCGHKHLEFQLVADERATVSGNVLDSSTSKCISKNGPQTERGSLPFGPTAAFVGLDGRRQHDGQEFTLKPRHWGEKIGLVPVLNVVEEWEIYGRTRHVHPVHIHLARFQVINRQFFDQQGHLIEGEEGPNLNELGLKDTILVYPGQVTRIRLRFEKPGLYVWHCHLLEHEDNEMMLPFCVKDPNKDLASSPGCAAANAIRNDHR